MEWFALLIFAARGKITDYTPKTFIQKVYKLLSRNWQIPWKSFLLFVSFFAGITVRNLSTDNLWLICALTHKYMCFTVLLIAVSLTKNAELQVKRQHSDQRLSFTRCAKGFNIFVLSHTFYTTKEIKLTSIKRKVTKALAFSLRVAGAGCKQAFFFTSWEKSDFGAWIQYSHGFLRW